MVVLYPTVAGRGLCIPTFCYYTHFRAFIESWQHCSLVLKSPHILILEFTLFPRKMNCKNFAIVALFIGMITTVILR